MTNGKVVFVTGTDTGVCKTVISAVLTRGLIRQGLNVRPLKLFSSGGREDAEILCRAAGGNWTIDEINPFAFQAALTPLLAAEMEGRHVSLEEAVGAVESARVHCDVLIVEGAGGLMSPLGRGYDATDLLRELDAQSVLVTMDRLGVLNQALMALRVMEKADLADPCLVLNRPGSGDHSRLGNLEMLRRLRPQLGIDTLGEMGLEQLEQEGVNFLQKTLATIRAGT